VSEQKHTEGPLEVIPGSRAPSGFNHYDVAFLAEHHFYAIGRAYAHTESLSVGVSGGDALPAEANARLWAASPDLLRACEAALKALRPLAGDTATLREIQRAVAKARGEAQP
jgi:hypothetical protein